jgi:hypothetical protein
LEAQNIIFVSILMSPYIIKESFINLDGSFFYLFYVIINEKGFSMSVKEDELTRLQDELLVIENSIKNIVQSGQGFRKGGFSGFQVEQAKLSELRKERSELRAKIALWGLHND